MFDVIRSAFTNEIEVRFDTNLVTFRCGDRFKSLAPHVYVSRDGGEIIRGFEVAPGEEHERVDLFDSGSPLIGGSLHRRCLLAFCVYGMANVPARFAMRRPSVVIHGLHKLEAADDGQLGKQLVNAFTRGGAFRCTIID